MINTPFNVAERFRLQIRAGSTRYFFKLSVPAYWNYLTTEGGGSNSDFYINLLMFSTTPSAFRRLNKQCHL